MLKNSFLISLILFAFSLFILFFINNNMFNFANINSQEYCEFNNYSSWIRQTSNTLSNYLFYFVGVYILLQKKSKSKNWTQIFGIITILIGFSSLLFHGSYITWSKTFDSSLVFAAALLPILILFGFKNKLLLILLASTLVFAAFNINAIYFVFVIILISIPIFISKTKKRTQFNLRYLIIAVTLLLISFSIRQIGVSKTFCLPNSLIQLHAVWHLGGAYGYYYLYKFLISFK